MQASIPNKPGLSLSPKILFSDAYFYSVQLKVGERLTDDGILVECPNQEESFTLCLILSRCLWMKKSRVDLEFLYFACHLVGSLFVWNPLGLIKGGRVLNVSSLRQGLYPLNLPAPS